MSQNDDILHKADALLNRHHAGSHLPEPEQQPESGYLHGYQADIPTLTEIVPERDLASELERELIPTLTEPIHLELDLDPDYGYHHHDAHALTGTETQAPEVAEEFMLDEAMLESAEAEAEAAMVAQFEEMLSAAEFLPEATVAAEEPVGQTGESAVVEHVPLPDAAEAVVEASAEPEAVPEAAPAVQPPVPEPEAVPYAAAAVSSAYRVERRMHISDSVAEQLLASLQQQVPKLLEQAIVPKLAAALDREISALIDQFTIHIEYVVRDAITSELQKQLPELEARLANTGKPPVDPV
jgi:hypothetical protein